MEDLITKALIEAAADCEFKAPKRRRYHRRGSVTESILRSNASVAVDEIGIHRLQGIANRQNYSEFDLKPHPTLLSMQQREDVGSMRLAKLCKAYEANILNGVSPKRKRTMESAVESSNEIESNTIAKSNEGLSQKVLTEAFEARRTSMKLLDKLPTL